MKVCMWKNPSMLTMLWTVQQEVFQQYGTMRYVSLWQNSWQRRDMMVCGASTSSPLGWTSASFYSQQGDSARLDAKARGSWGTPQQCAYFDVRTWAGHMLQMKWRGEVPCIWISCPWGRTRIFNPTGIQHLRRDGKSCYCGIQWLVILIAAKREPSFWLVVQEGHIPTSSQLNIFCNYISFQNCLTNYSTYSV